MKTEFESILKSLNVKVIDHIDKHTKKDKAFVYGEINRRDVLVKIVSNKEKDKIEGLQKEVVVDEIIEKHNKDLSLPFVYKAAALFIGNNGKYSWIVRRYYKGKSLSKIKEKDVFLIGYDIIQNSYLLNHREIINQIVDNLKALSTITKDFRKLKVKSDYFKKRYNSNIEEFFIKEIEEGLSLSLGNQVKYYNLHKEEYLSEDNIKAYYGDLIPANIILKEDKKILFSDFEWFGFDNYMMDVAFLWLFLWRYPRWQGYLLKLSIKNEMDRTSFRMSVIRQIVGKYSITFDPKRKKDLDRISQIKKHIWTKYLRACGESFEALINTK